MFTRPFIVSGCSQSGVVTIPIGARCWGINVVSGSTFINGFPCAAGYSVNISLPDSKNLLGTPIVVSGAGAGSSTNVFWVQ